MFVSRFLGWLSVVRFGVGKVYFGGMCLIYKSIVCWSFVWVVSGCSFRGSFLGSGEDKRQFLQLNC